MIKFGGFIITYNRPLIILETISKIFSQTFPPEKIWVIDNSNNFQTRTILQGYEKDRISYYSMGYNAGPAGAAAKGLELCYNDGFEWIYWGDDNDPPFSNICFERLLLNCNEFPNTGIIGAVGQYFDKKKGVVNRVPTKLLQNSKTLRVDFVAGGKSMLINRLVVQHGVLPNVDLFFGFEELDFCLKVKTSGFEILVDSKLFLEARTESNRMNYNRPLYQKKGNLAREYYSLRNLLIISENISPISMKIKLHLKGIGKSIYGYKFGWKYGNKNAYMITLAIYHYWKGISGKTLDLN